MVKNTKRSFSIKHNIRLEIFEQFDLMFSIIPHYQKYAYLNAVMDNEWAGKLKKWEAEMIYTSWQESRRAIAKIWSGNKKINKKQIYD